MAQNVMDQLRTDGKVSRGKLGVTHPERHARTSPPAWADRTSAARSSAASSRTARQHRAGIRQGDVILIDGEKLADNNALRNRIAGTKPGSTSAIEVLRDGRNQTLHATLDAQKADGVSGRPEAVNQTIRASA